MFCSLLSAAIIFGEQPGALPLGDAGDLLNVKLDDPDLLLRDSDLEELLLLLPDDGFEPVKNNSTTLKFVLWNTVDGKTHSNTSGLVERWSSRSKTRPRSETIILLLVHYEL